MNLINEKAIDEYVKKFNFKQLLIFPAALLVISLLILTYTTLTSPTDTPVELGMEFQGGMAIIFDTTKTPDS